MSKAALVARPRTARRSAGGGVRNAEDTKARILRAARVEFARHGYSGGRIDRIAKRFRSNIRLIYHYFGKKDQLYLAVLEDIYSDVRKQEEALDLRHLDPVEGMTKLVNLTFEYLRDNPEFVRIVANENLLMGKFLRKSRMVPEKTEPLTNALYDLLKRGQRDGTFHKKIDPVQLYVTILAQCFIHISNVHTLSIMFERDLSDPKWQKQRQQHVVDLILTYLTSDSAQRS